MSANVQSMLYVGQPAWHGLGRRYETPPSDITEILQGSGLDWETSSTPVRTDIHGILPNKHAIYRTDIEGIDGFLGEVETSKLKIVQNRDTFSSVESLLGSGLYTETAASLGRGEEVFGCFKINEGYRLIDDDIDHYIVVFNDHLKPDGKVTIINTPIRVVCQNTLSAALSSAQVKFRVGCSTDTTKNQSIAHFIRDTILSSQKVLTKHADSLLKQPLTNEDVERLLDELFPYIAANEGSTHARANETTSMVRGTFLQSCLDVDNLQNYKGTHYQLWNALLDFTQHWYPNNQAGVDPEMRMKNMPGKVKDARVGKYQKIFQPKIA